VLFHLTPHRGDLRTLGALPFPQVGRDTTHGSLGEGTSARKAWRWAGDVEMGWVRWRWAGPWRWVGDVEAGWGRGDAGPSQHRSSQAGASPSPETRAGPDIRTRGTPPPAAGTDAHPWDTTPGDTQPAHRDTRDTHTPHAITPALLVEPGPRWCGGRGSQGHWLRRRPVLGSTQR